ADIQIQQKQQHLLENLERIGGVKPNHVLKPITGPLWAYRRRARLTVRFVDKKERVLVGFRERLSHYIADIERCEVLSGNVGDLVRPLADLIGGLSIKRHVPQVEVAVADNATILVFRILESLTDGDKQKILEFAAETGVCAYIQTGGLDTIAPLAAPATLHYSLPQQSLTFDFGPSDFVQINGEINQQIVTKAIELLELQGDEKLLDLFCGLGNFSLSLARHCAQVVGVEGSESLVQKARANAQANGIHNAEFFVADLFKDVSDFAWAKGQYDVLFLDPPRAGAKEIMTLLESMNPSKVLYVSCHPGSLARDAETLVQAGFTLVHAGVADMFPHTAHVESIGLFLRPE
ncbi:MAG: 23S rRNA (uracil(1939)-C(5))-methyltransferase RlmD, partial [Pseudomonadota bacterium]